MPYFITLYHIIICGLMSIFFNRLRVFLTWSFWARQACPTSRRNFHTDYTDLWFLLFCPSRDACPRKDGERESRFFPPQSDALSLIEVPQRQFYYWLISKDQRESASRPPPAQIPQIPPSKSYPSPHRGGLGGVDQDALTFSLLWVIFIMSSALWTLNFKLKKGGRQVSTD